MPVKVSQSGLKLILIDKTLIPRWSENLYLFFVTLYIIEIFPLLQFFIHKPAQSDEAERKKNLRRNVRAGSSLQNITEVI